MALANNIKEYIMDINQFFKKNKIIKNIRDAIDSYLTLEVELQDTIDKAQNGYCYEDVYKPKLFYIESALDLQHTFLEEQLNLLGCDIAAAEIVNIYSDSKIKALQILQGV